MSAQSSLFGPSPQRSAASGSARGPKIVKACEECRRRKQRCDGQTPCSICARRRAPCSYRTTFKNRLARSSRNGPNDANTADASHAMPPRMHIFNNIRATHVNAGTELFYGASSVFSLLQHLDVHLPSQTVPAPYPHAGADEVHDGDESIQRYNYQNIAFDCVPQPMSRAAHCVFISQDLARASLRNFLLTAHHLTPFLEPERLSSTLEKLYDPSESREVQPADRALVVVSMAIGAALTKNSPCREHLIAQARTETEGILYVISLRAVQVALLMAQCEFESGNPNICYLQLGSAVRKAFAAGIHRANSPEAKQTMWALYCAESTVCLMIGRQPSLAEDDMMAPTLEQRPSFLGSSVRLCTLIRSAYRIYRPDTSMTIAIDMSRAYAIHQELCEFSRTLRADLSLDIGGQLYALTGEALSWHVTMSYLYHFTILIVYRPFVLLAAELRRRRRHQQQQRGPPTNAAVESVDLEPAIDACLHSARSIVHLSESLFSLQIGVEGFYNHAFFLESACFVLVLAAVYDNDDDNDSNDTDFNGTDTDADTTRRSRRNHIHHVNAGLALVRKLGCGREPVRSIVAALEQMLARVNALPSGGGGGGNSDVREMTSGGGGENRRRRQQPQRGRRRRRRRSGEGDMGGSAEAAAEEEDDDDDDEEEEERGEGAMAPASVQSPAAPAFGQLGGVAGPLVPPSGEDGGSGGSDVLDELWSMTDWDLSFPLVDFQSYVPR